MWYTPVIEKGEYSKTLTNRRYIMDPIVWRTISQIAVFVGSGLALTGGIGTWYFGNKVEKIMPFRQSISTASATVEVIVSSDEQVNAWYGDRGGYLALIKPDNEVSLLTLSSQESWGNQIGDGRVRYKGIFNMDANDVAVGKPVNYLKEAEYAAIFFHKLPKGKEILNVKAVCTVNSNIRFEFNISGAGVKVEQGNGGIILVKCLSESFSHFEQ